MDFTIFLRCTGEEKQLILGNKDVQIGALKISDLLLNPRGLELLCEELWKTWSEDFSQSPISAEVPRHTLVLRLEFLLASPWDAPLHRTGQKDSDNRMQHEPTQQIR